MALVSGAEPETHCVFDATCVCISGPITFLADSFGGALCGAPPAAAVGGASASVPGCEPPAGPSPAAAGGACDCCTVNFQLRASFPIARFTELAPLARASAGV